MTMRLDIVTNDAGELVRREHARDLGASVVISIYRLAKLSQVHDLQNQAFVRQLEQTHQIIGEYCLRSGMNVSVLFANKAIFVAGQLLKGSRATYEAAAELGEIFERLGGSDLFIERSITRDEVLAFAEQISIGFRSAPGSFRSPTPKIRLRRVNDAARLRGMELEDLTEEQRIVRAYASAVVIMRRFYEDLEQSKYILPRRIKRIAQSLVDLSAGSTPAYLGVTEVRNANHDEAGRAVNTAILAVSIARECTQERGILSQVAMAAMMHDVSRPRAMALAAAGGPAMPGMAGPSTLSEDQEDRLAAGAAAVLTALGRVNEPSITRTVLTFEALWLRRQQWLGPVYWGARSPTLHAKMIAIARRYNDLLTPEPGLMPPPPDYAVAVLAEELKDPQDRAVLRMLVSALGLLPVGTLVQLNTGEMAEVVRGPTRPGERAVMRLRADANGQPVASTEIDLAQDLRRQVARIISVEGWREGLKHRPGGQGEIPEDGGYDPDAQRSAPPAPAPAPAPAPQSVAALAARPNPQPSLSPVAIPAQGQAAPAASQATRSRAEPYAQWGEPHVAGGDRHDPSAQSGEHPSSVSLPSLGSSPSAVAEAMGRMISDSLRPPVSPAPRGAFHPQGGETSTQPELVSKGASAAREPTARGNLAATPLPHVLVYMLDHALSGSVVFDNEASNDTIYFVNGVPAKLRLREPVGLLGEVLLMGGALDRAQLDRALEGARGLGILLGDYLVGHDLATREQVDWALEAQILQKIAHIANLPPEIEYTYYRDTDLLDGWGGGHVAMSAPLNPILAGVRNWLDRARVRATLNRIGKHPLVVHEESDLSNLALLPEERAVLDVIESEALSLPQLFNRNIADEETVSSLVYTLAVTRQFAFKGQKKGPMAARGTAPWRATEAVAPGGSKAEAAAGAPPAAAASLPVSSAKSGSSSRPNPEAASAARPIQSATRLADAVGSSGPEMPRSSPSVSVSVPPAARKGGSVPATSPSGAPRPIAPAARPSVAPGVPKLNAPRIQKKQGTIVGLQPSQPPPARAPSDSPSLPSDDSSSGDDAKTIALAAPAFKNFAPRRAAPIPLPSKSASGALPAAKSGTMPYASRAQAPAPAPAKGEPPPANAWPATGFGAGSGAFDLEPEEGNVGGADPSLGEAELALEAMSSFRLAEAALQRSDTATALKHAEKAAASDPTVHDYAVLVAWIKALGGDPQDMQRAIGTMSKVLLDDPSNERALLYRGKLLVRTNRFHDALTDFTELLATNPHHREAAAELRGLKQRMGG